GGVRRVLVLGGGGPPRSSRPSRKIAALMAGLASLGCAPQAQAGHRLPTLNCLRVPAGVDEAVVRKTLLAEYGIEIGGGLGPLAGLVWRIGLMGESSRHEHVVTLLSALEKIFHQQGWTKQSGAALTAAPQSYATATL